MGSAQRTFGGHPLWRAISSGTLPRPAAVVGVLRRYRAAPV